MPAPLREFLVIGWALSMDYEGLMLSDSIFFHALFLFSSLAGKTHVAQGTMERWLSFACSLPCRPLFRELDGTYTCNWSLFFTSSSPASQFSVHWKSLQSFSSAELWPSSQMVVSALNGEEPMCLLLFFSMLAFQRATSSLLSPPAAVTNHLFSAFISH